MAPPPRKQRRYEYDSDADFCPGYSDIDDEHFWTDSDTSSDSDSSDITLPYVPVYADADFDPDFDPDAPPPPPPPSPSLSPSSSVSSLSSSDSMDEDGLLQCEICGHLFLGLVGLTNHQFSITENGVSHVTCDNLEDGLDPEPIDLRILRSFQCGTCGIEFRQESGLTSHQCEPNNEDEEPKYQCGFCGLYLVSLRDLEGHQFENRHGELTCDNNYSNNISF